MVTSLLSAAGERLHSDEATNAPYFASHAGPSRKRRRVLVPKGKQAEHGISTHSLLANQTASSEAAPRVAQRALALEHEVPSITEAPYVSDGLIVRGGSLDDHLRFLQHSLITAEAQLLRERLQRAQSERQVRQDMYLEMLSIKENARRDLEKSERLLSRQTRLCHEKSEINRDLESKLEVAEGRLPQLVAELEVVREDLQHAMDINATLSADVDELRQIQNEQTAAEHRRDCGLPPAYGSLENQELPVYHLHNDSGALNVATLKRSARELFNTVLHEGRARSHRLHAEPSISKGTRQLYATTSALYETSRSLELVLRESYDEWCTDVSLRNGGSAGDTVRRIPARRHFIASRIAKTLLELGWLAISLNELRPASLNISSRLRSVLNIMHSHIDNVLLESLRQWNGLGDRGSTKTSTERAMRHENLQAFLTQLSALEGRSRQLDGPFGGSKDEKFTKSLQWLEEVVEFLRVDQANRSPSATREGTRAERACSIISSEGVPEHSESEAEG